MAEKHRNECIDTRANMRGPDHDHSVYHLLFFQSQMTPWAKFNPEGDTQAPRNSLMCPRHVVRVYLRRHLGHVSALSEGPVRSRHILHIDGILGHSTRGRPHRNMSGHSERMSCA